MESADCRGAIVQPCEAGGEGTAMKAMRGVQSAMHTRVLHRASMSLQTIEFGKYFAHDMHARSLHELLITGAHA
eukprot:361095-Chlamydomonas_euryale.AAC.15